MYLEEKLTFDSARFDSVSLNPIIACPMISLYFDVAVVVIEPCTATPTISLHFAVIEHNHFITCCRKTHSPYTIFLNAVTQP